MHIQFNELKEMLNRGPMTFLFRKKDGSARKMTATTNSEWIPNNERIIQRSEKAVTVYDMEKKAIRSVSAESFVCA